MKVGIYQTCEVSDEQRAMIAAKLGKKVATRDDMKDYIWERGSEWAGWLSEVTPEPEGDDEDLLGGGDEDLLGGADEDDDEGLI